jgi:hypothetical protein
VFRAGVAIERWIPGAEVMQLCREGLHGTGCWSQSELEVCSHNRAT